MSDIPHSATNIIHQGFGQVSDAGSMAPCFILEEPDQVFGDLLGYDPPIMFLKAVHGLLLSLQSTTLYLESGLNELRVGRV